MSAANNIKPDIQKENHKKNLLENKTIKSVLKSRWFPGIIQLPVLAVFALIVFELS